MISLSSTFKYRFYLIKYDGLIDAVSRSYAVRREDSDDFIMIQICS